MEIWLLDKYCQWECGKGKPEGLHYAHIGVRCSWHDDTCEEAVRNPKLFCQCAGSTMNYTRASQRIDLYWEWTTTRDGKTHRSLPCTEECKHVAKEDAERHFYEYCLEQAQVHLHKDELHLCILCSEWTDRTYGNYQMWLSLEPVELCEEHCNKESLKQVYPFVSGTHIVHS